MCFMCFMVPPCAPQRKNAEATVKPAIVKETLDPSKGAVIRLDPDAPVLTTPATRPGLTYTLREGRTLDGMANGASTVGNASPGPQPLPSRAA